jgi:hypothetical protein
MDTMNRLVSSAALLLVWFGTAGLGVAACTATSGVEDGGITPPSDAGNQTDGPSSGSEGGACSTAYSTGTAACDTCVQMNCEMAWCVCTQDTPIAFGDSGSLPGCMAYTGCVSAETKLGDAGSLSQAEADCTSASKGFPASSVASGDTFLACVATGGPCATQCTQ